MASQVIKHLRITGRVQGVSYRMSMVAAARQLRVRGWVRNCADGSVEAVLQGEVRAVDDLISWARVGPPHARVAGVEIHPGSGDFGPFAARKDA